MACATFGGECVDKSTIHASRWHYANRTAKPLNIGRPQGAPTESTVTHACRSNCVPVGAFLRCSGGQRRGPPRLLVANHGVEYAQQVTHADRKSTRLNSSH